MADVNAIAESIQELTLMERVSIEHPAFNHSGLELERRVLLGVGHQRLDQTQRVLTGAGKRRRAPQIPQRFLERSVFRRSRARRF